MGNHLATLSSQAELNLPELGPTVLFLERLGGGRFIKSLKCSHENHILVVKVYCKSAAAESVEGYGEELALLLSKLSATHAPNVQPFRWFKETSTAAFIARQYIHSNLLELLRLDFLRCRDCLFRRNLLWWTGSGFLPTRRLPDAQVRPFRRH